MKYLLLMGASGSGKTTLAKKLEEQMPNKFKRIIQCTTRQIRNGETNNVDYKFIPKSDYKRIREYMTARVEKQFKPNYYGTLLNDLAKDNNIWNIIVVSIEGFVDFIKNGPIKADDEVVLMNIIINNNSDVSRPERSPITEQEENIKTIDGLKVNGELPCKNNKVHLIEIQHHELAKIRDDVDKLTKYICKKLTK